MNTFLRRLLLIAVAALCFARPALAATSYGYAANAGWIVFGQGSALPPASGAKVLSGYAYAANVGWINFGDGTPANGTAYSNTSAGDYGVNRDTTGRLSGYAYSANTGWINFSWATASDPNRPRIDPVTGAASGFGYSANIGWINLNAFTPADTTKPVISPLPDLTLKATGSSGAIATYTGSAADDKDGPVPVTFTPPSGSLFPIGTTTVTASATDSAGNKATKTFTVTVTSSVPSGYTAWASENGLTGANNAFTADPDADGIVNLLEYFLKLRPTISDPVGLPTGDVEGSEFVFRFNRAKAATGVTHRILISSDLIAWAPVSPAPVLESSNATLETYVVKIPVSSSRLFARLEVTAAPAAPIATVPLGALRFMIAGGTPTAPATTVFGIPLTDTSAPAAGIRVGRIESFTATTITQSLGGWTGNLAAPATPWAVRITSGAAAGKLLDITANSATTLTVSGVNLTTLGIVAGMDTFELVPMDTLFSLFGSDTLLGGTSVNTADTVQVRNGATWSAFYYDTTLGFWRRTVGPAVNSNNVLIRPSSGVQIIRRGPAFTLIVTGRIPWTTFRTPILNASGTVIHSGFPTDTTLGALALQTRLTGWRSAATPAAADVVSLFNGTSWVGYFHNGSHWQPVAGAAKNSNAVAIPAGALLTLQRPGATAGTTDLVRILPYSL